MKKQHGYAKQLLVDQVSRTRMLFSVSVYEHTILSIDVNIVLYMFFIFLSLPFNLILANLCLSNLIRQVWNMGGGEEEGKTERKSRKAG
jgi:hypothetical protein